MSIIDRLFDEFLKSLPYKVKRWLFPILLVTFLEVGTYCFFALFFFASLGKETFRSVLTHFGWQVVALSELSIVVGISLLWSVRKLPVQSGKLWRILVPIAVVIVLMVPVGFYFLCHPHVLDQEHVDIFYLDYPEPVEEFDKDHIIKLLTAGSSRGIRTSFSWVSWSKELIPSDFETLDPLEKLDVLAQKYGGTNPIGITSSPLPGNLFSIALLRRRIKLSVISVADWKTRFAPPTVYEYLLHMIYLTTIRYRLNMLGESIDEHKIGVYNQAYFDKVIEKSELRTIISNGRFLGKDANVIRKFLGEKALVAYQDVLSLHWLQEGDLQK